MGYLSLNVQVAGKVIVVVGGGRVAERKIAHILPAGALVTVVSPKLTFDLQKLRGNDMISHVAREYQAGDLRGAFMVIAATDDLETNHAVADEARERGILAEITDKPASGTVTSPAVIRQGDLSIAISTNNLAPALAAAVKRELAPLFGSEYAKTLRLMGHVREKLLTDGRGSPYYKEILNELAVKLPALYAANAYGEIDTLLQKFFGQRHTMSAFDSECGDNQ
jgi:precorrin-2 dehydrogenase/sirohydrochlorin ferrochelatase